MGRLPPLLPGHVVALLLLAANLGVSQPPLDRDAGLPRVHWQNADRIVGTLAVVSGKIVRVGRSGRVSFLNFDEQRRDVFKVVVFADDLPKFPQPLEKLYDQQLVSVRGVVSLYRGVPQIQVSSPAQITLVEELPPETNLDQPRREPGETIRVATFNVRNLFDDVDDPYTADETTPAKPRRELTRIAATMLALDADVIALQEVERRGYLERFGAALLHELSYEVVHFEGNDLRGSSVAVLTRIPVGSVTSHRHRQLTDETGQTRRFSRDLLCVELQPRNRNPFEVWVTHLKSKRGGAAETTPQRLAETTAIRQLLVKRLQHDAEARILVVGDFNDTRDSRPIRRLLEPGPGQLRSLWHSLKGDAVTYNREPYREMIDFIFATPAAAARYVEKSYAIFDSSLEESGSDHNPVVAEFAF